MERILPKGAFIVKRDEPRESGSLIISVGPIEKPNRGTIILTGPDLQSFKHSSVVFRENFYEIIDIDNEKELLYFRDFNSSIYYVEDDKK